MHLHHKNKAESSSAVNTNKICTEKQLLSVENSGVFRTCKREGAGSGGQKSPNGVQWQSPGRGSGGGKVPQKLKLFC